MNLFEQLERSTERFHKPENFDKVGEGSGWVVYAGGNDWENCATAVAVVFPENESIERIWFEIKFPRGLEKTAKHSEGSNEKAEQCRAHAKRAWRTWMRCAREAHAKEERLSRSTHYWKEAFKTAIQDRQMAKYVSTWGVQQTDWKTISEALVERLLA